MTTHAVDRGGLLHQINQTAGRMGVRVVVDLPRATHLLYHITVWVLSYPARHVNNDDDR
jgi:hypothetical protein